MAESVLFACYFAIITLGISPASSGAERGAAESVPALVRDLPGWTAGSVAANHLKIAETVNGPAQDLVTVTRRYRQDGRLMDVQFFGGLGAVSPIQPKEESADTAAGSFRISRINGFMTMLTSQQPVLSKAGQVSLIVWLNGGAETAAVLAVTGHDMTGDEILAAASLLDWKALAAAPRLS